MKRYVMNPFPLLDHTYESEEEIMFDMVYEAYQLLKGNYPTICVFWMFAFFRENQAVLNDRFYDIYEKYEETHFTIGKLSKEDIQYMELRLWEESRKEIENQKGE